MGVPRVPESPSVPPSMEYGPRLPQMGGQVADLPEPVSTALDQHRLMTAQQGTLARFLERPARRQQVHQHLMRSRKSF